MFLMVHLVYMSSFITIVQVVPKLQINKVMSVPGFEPQSPHPQPSSLPMCPLSLKWELMKLFPFLL